MNIKIASNMAAEAAEYDQQGRYAEAEAATLRLARYTELSAAEHGLVSDPVRLAALQQDIESIRVSIAGNPKLRKAAAPLFKRLDLVLRKEASSLPSEPHARLAAIAKLVKTAAEVSRDPSESLRGYFSNDHDFELFKNEVAKQFAQLDDGGTRSVAGKLGELMPILEDAFPNNPKLQDAADRAMSELADASLEESDSNTKPFSQWVEGLEHRDRVRQDRAPQVRDEASKRSDVDAAFPWFEDPLAQEEASGSPEESTPTAIPGADSDAAHDDGQTITPPPAGTDTSMEEAVSQANDDHAADAVNPVATPEPSSDGDGVGDDALDLSDLDFTDDEGDGAPKDGPSTPDDVEDILGQLGLPKGPGTPAVDDSIFKGEVGDPTPDSVEGGDDQGLNPETDLEDLLNEDPIESPEEFQHTPGSGDPLDDKALGVPTDGPPPTDVPVPTGLPAPTGVPTGGPEPFEFVAPDSTTPPPPPPAAAPVVVPPPAPIPQNEEQKIDAAEEEILDTPTPPPTTGGPTGGLPAPSSVPVPPPFTPPSGTNLPPPIPSGLPSTPPLPPTGGPSLPTGGPSIPSSGPPPLPSGSPTGLPPIQPRPPRPTGPPPILTPPGQGGSPTPPPRQAPPRQVPPVIAPPVGGGSGAGPGAGGGMLDQLRDVLTNAQGLKPTTRYLVVPLVNKLIDIIAKEQKWNGGDMDWHQAAAHALDFGRRHGYGKMMAMLQQNGMPPYWLRHVDDMWAMRNTGQPNNAMPPGPFQGMTPPNP